MIETGHAVERGARESRTPTETSLVEASIAEERRTRKVRGRIEGGIHEPGETLEHRAAQGDRGIEGGAGKIQVRQRRAFEIERLVDGDAAQILDLAPSERLRELGDNRDHQLLAAPAGGPAKASANGPIATMSTSTSCGPLAASARSRAGANSSTRDTR